MTQIHERRSSDHPYIDTVWTTRNIADGTYLATPDGSWDLILCTSENGERVMMLTGQASKSSHVPYKAGTSSVVISFAAGIYLPHAPGDQLLDVVEWLPNVDEDHFSLAGKTFMFPTFEDAEKLIDEMIESGVLAIDEVVASALSKGLTPVSDRATQRHFIRTTGLTQKYLQQIRRAQQAVRLLKRGKKPVDAAVDAGYADQPHLAKSLKRIMGTKPSDIDDIHKL